MADELADAIAGRDDWEMKGTTARYGPIDNGWSGKVIEVAGALRRANAGAPPAPQRRDHSIHLTVPLPGAGRRLG
jgi:hypothetical protein